SSTLQNDVAAASIPAALQSQFAELLSGCALVELSARVKLALTGSDRQRWLNGMVTNNIRDLAPGHGVYAFLLNPQGHILGDMYAYNRGESILLDTDQSQLEKLLAVFDRYIIMDDVEIANLTERLHSFAVIGPRSEAILRKAGFDFPPLETLQFAGVSWQA